MDNLKKAILVKKNQNLSDIKTQYEIDRETTKQYDKMLTRELMSDDDSHKNFRALINEIKLGINRTGKEYLRTAKKIFTINAEKKYKSEYVTFEKAIETELGIKPSTAYEYIDNYKYFGEYLRARGGFEKFEPSKTRYFIPLLRDEKISETKKDEIRNIIIKEMPNKTSREMKKRAEDLKQKYNRVEKSIIPEMHFIKEYTSKQREANKLFNDNYKSEIKPDKKDHPAIKSVKEFIQLISDFSLPESVEFLESKEDIKAYNELLEIANKKAKIILNGFNKLKG